MSPVLTEKARPKDGLAFLLVVGHQLAIAGVGSVFQYITTTLAGESGVLDDTIN